MVFAKRLREGVRRGEITCSVRIWVRPHVQIGARYRMGEGEIEIDPSRPSGFRYYFGTGAGIGIPGNPRSAASSEAREGRQDLSDPISLFGSEWETLTTRERVGARVAVLAAALRPRISENQR